MTVHQGPFNSVYAGHAALHVIDTGLILTLSYSLPVSIFLLSGSLPVYSCTIRLTAVILRLAACLVLRYQAHILSLSGLLQVYSHSQACCLTLTQARCLSILTPSGSLPVYSLTIRLTAYLFSCAHSGLLPIYSHSIRLAANLFSLLLRLAAYLFSLSLRLAACLCILRLTA